MSEQPENRFDVAISLRFEVFYALQILLDDDARIHQRWRERAKQALPKKFFADLAQIGESSVVWALVADTLREHQGDLDITQICRLISNADTRRLQSEIIEGAIHDDALAEALVTGKIRLRDAFTKVPKVKQEWLAFIGLYPFQKGSPIAMALDLLLTKPAEFKRIVVGSIQKFWDSSFKNTWHQIQSQLSRSAEEKARLLHTCTLGEFAKQSLLRIEVDDAQKIIRAARGGYELNVEKIRRGYFMPSAFNDKRYWTAYEFDDGVDVYFPYFDPSISLDLGPKNSIHNVQRPEIDPFLVFKALGDSTRYAMALLIAQRSRSAVEIAKELGLSKPTISHHVHVLRDAGLIEESYQSGQRKISG